VFGNADSVTHSAGAFSDELLLSLGHSVSQNLKFVDAYVNGHEF
jgi:hypothetical protein